PGPQVHARLPAAGAVSQRAQSEVAGAPHRFRRVLERRGNRDWNFRDGLPCVGRRTQAVYADRRMGGRPACARRRPLSGDLRAGAHPHSVLTRWLFAAIPRRTDLPAFRIGPEPTTPGSKALSQQSKEAMKRLGWVFVVATDTVALI